MRRRDSAGIRGDRRDRRRPERAGALAKAHRAAPLGRSSPAASTTRAASRSRRTATSGSPRPARAAQVRASPVKRRAIPRSCFGTSGAFTLIHNGVQKRVVTGLPSFGDEGTGDNAIGA